MQIELPKVLVVDVNAWQEEAASNTLLEVFRCWSPDKLGLVYTSSFFPDTTVCNHFFQIGENQVLRSVFKPWITVGREVNSTSASIDSDAVSEQKLRSRSHRSHSGWMRFAREIVWKLGHWRSSRLNAFVRDFNPDILFIPIFPYAYMGRIQKHIIKFYKKPVVCYLADDNYSYDACKGIYDYLIRFWNRKYVRYLATSCSEMFVIVEKEKEDTDRRFGTNSVILTKSVDFSDLIYKERTPNNPLKIVYTGSLLIGRGNTLVEVAKAVNDINSEQNRLVAELFVYSQTIPSIEILSQIDQGSSHFCGTIPRQSIQTVINEADVVVFAEALYGREANVAKLSFSTKITDYLSSGKCILAIGKQDIAPIEYLRSNNAAIIACSSEDIKLRICEIVANPSVINDYGHAAYQCAKNNHEKEMMTDRFINTMLRAYDHQNEKENLCYLHN